MNKKLKIIVSVLLILILGLIILTAFNYKNQNKKKSVKFNYINDSITINLYNLKDVSMVITPFLAICREFSNMPAYCLIPDVYFPSIRGQSEAISVRHQ